MCVEAADGELTFAPVWYLQILFSAKRASLWSDVSSTGGRALAPTWMAARLAAMRDEQAR